MAAIDDYRRLTQGTSPARGEWEALTPHLDDEERIWSRHEAADLRDDRGEVLMESPAVFTTDKRVLFAMHAGGVFRAKWTVTSHAFSNLELGARTDTGAAADSEVCDAKMNLRSGGGLVIHFRDRRTMEEFTRSLSTAMTSHRSLHHLDE